jgi:phospholipid/cholesterol/gamma-HCH transport system substrate-binding protein
MVGGAVDRRGNPVRFVDPGNLSMLGDDAWKWMLVGPVTE